MFIAVEAQPVCRELRSGALHAEFSPCTPYARQPVNRDLPITTVSSGGLWQERQGASEEGFHAEAANHIQGENPDGAHSDGDSRERTVCAVL